MLRLQPENPVQVQTPPANEKVWFMNESGELVMMDDARTIETLATSEGLAAATPNPKIYRALLTQTGTNAPVATVLENTLGGTITYAYTSVATYTATATGLLNATTGISIGGGHDPMNSANVPIYGIKSQGNDSFIITSADAMSQGPGYNGILLKTLITIYKYE